MKTLVLLLQVQWLHEGNRVPWDHSDSEKSQEGHKKEKNQAVPNWSREVWPLNQLAMRLIVSDAIEIVAG
jgi:hypothetical protein